MDYNAYRQKYLVEPPPEARFAYAGLHGITLYFGAYAAAVEFYTQVFGPPAYVEGAGTRGWRLGQTWLTLLHGQDRPQNVEVSLVMENPAAAEAVQAAFVAAGGQATAPSDQLMYAPVRSCPVTDPFGTEWLITAPLEAQG